MWAMVGLMAGSVSASVMHCLWNEMVERRVYLCTYAGPMQAASHWHNKKNISGRFSARE